MLSGRVAQGDSKPLFRGFAALLLVLGLVCPAAESRAAEAASDPKPKAGPPPAWITTNTFVPLPAAAFPPGEELRLLLSERQINVPEDETYVHVARQLLNVSGVQIGANVSVDFDPSYQELTLHSIKVWRGTNATERLDLGRVSTLRQERDLDRRLFNGESSAVLVLQDVRVGDVVEYAYSIKGRNPVFQGRFTGSATVQLSVPANRLVTRLIWPQDRRIQIKNHACNVRPARTTNGENLELVWDFRNIPAAKPEESLPGWLDPDPWVQLSEFQSWAEVVQWATGLFSDDSELPPELLRKIAEWKGIKDPEQQVVAALRYLQDEIRYFGIEIGAGSHQPSSPAVVFNRRFGDCKDKSLLFVRVMKALGVEAYPVLVNTELRKGVADLHPTTGAFDHAIAAIRLGKRVHWLDPSDSYQRGPLAAHYLPDYGYGLLVSPTAKTLTPIPPTTAPPETFKTESITVGRPGKASTLKVVTVATGGAAEQLRASFATSPLETLAKDHLAFYARTYPGITRDAPLAPSDDEARNRFTVTESYAIPDIWTRSERDQRLRCEFYPYEIAALLRKPTATTRRLPLGIAFPRRLVLRTEIEWPTEWRPEPAQVSVANAAFRFRKDTRSAGRKMVVEYEYQSLADAVPADLYPGYTRDITRATDSLGDAMSWR